MEDFGIRVLTHEPRYSPEDQVLHDEGMAKLKELRAAYEAAVAPIAAQLAEIEKRTLFEKTWKPWPRPLSATN